MDIGVLTDILTAFNHAVWGVPTLVLILGVGVLLTIVTGFGQITLFPRAVGEFFRKFRVRAKDAGTVSPYQALCTALAATVGTGNIAGVAGAIAIGGPGAIFWMWLGAFFGMVTKFAEAALAVQYRQRNADGEFVGGPMYMIQNGLGAKWKPLGAAYSFFGVVAAFGVGNATQINAVVTGANQAMASFGIAPSAAGDLVMGIVLAVVIAGILLGGMRRIGTLAEKLVPFASVVYILLGIMVLFLRFDAIIPAFRSIIAGAFTPSAFTGGVVGTAVMSLRTGISRGVFTNEAGMGTASIAHAAAQVKHPVEQGLMGIMEVFLDTIVICTMTALVILVSGTPIDYGVDTGAALTAKAFSAVLGDWADLVIAGALCCFALATVVGWGLYGVRCAQYIFGDGVWKKFVFLQCGAVILGAVLQTRTVWLLSEAVNGLMAIPNLTALLFLMPRLHHLVEDYRAQMLDKKRGAVVQ